MQHVPHNARGGRPSTGRRLGWLAVGLLLLAPGLARAQQPGGLYDTTPRVPAPPRVYGPATDVPAAGLLQNPFRFGFGPSAFADIFDAPAPRSPNFNSLYSTSNAANRLRSPYLIGDVEGGGSGAIGTEGMLTVVEHPTFAVNRLNIAENNSPIPQDRVYFRYNHLHNSSDTRINGLPPGPLGQTFSSSLSVDRYTFGMEKAFSDGRFSLEGRVPFARQLTNDIEIASVDGGTNLPLDDRSTQLGNVSFVGKMLLYDDERLLVSGGLGVLLPTAPDVDFKVLVASTAPAPFLFDFHGTVDNRVVELTPFLSALYTPDDRWFFQGFTQLSVPLNKERVALSQSFTDVNGTLVDPTFTGSFRVQEVLRMNIGGGYWLFRNHDADFFTGLAFSVEAHYTTTLRNAQLVTGYNLAFAPDDVAVGNFSNRIDILNFTAGPTLEIRRNTTLAVGIVAPVRDQSDRAFDCECNVQLNHRF